MKYNEPKLVMRGSTKYLEQRIERTRATGYIDDVYAKTTEINNKAITKKTIRIYGIKTEQEQEIAKQDFYYGKEFEHLRWKRNSSIVFEGTVYKLTKCKGKNDQKPGSRELIEIRNPRKVRVIELDTDSRIGAPKRESRRSSRKDKQVKIRRIELRELIEKQKEDLARELGLPRWKEWIP